MRSKDYREWWVNMNSEGGGQGNIPTFEW